MNHQFSILSLFLAFALASLTSRAIDKNKKEPITHFMTFLKKSSLSVDELNPLRKIADEVKSFLDCTITFKSNSFCESSSLNGSTIGQCFVSDTKHFKHCDITIKKDDSAYYFVDIKCWLYDSGYDFVQLSQTSSKDGLTYVVSTSQTESKTFIIAK